LIEESEALLLSEQRLLVYLISDSPQPFTDSELLTE